METEKPRKPKQHAAPDPAQHHQLLTPPTPPPSADKAPQPGLARGPVSDCWSEMFRPAGKKLWGAPEEGLWAV